MSKRTMIVAAGMLIAASSFQAPDAYAEETKKTAADPGAVIDPGAAISGLYENDKGHSYISFSYLHQGYSRPLLRWRAWTSVLNWNADDPTRSTVSVIIDAKSVDTGVDKFDEHLRSDDFFDTEKFPEVKFESTELKKTSDRTGILTGNLTVKDITKPVTLNVVFNKAANDSFAKTYKLGFSATGQVKRTDFGVGAYAPFVGDEVDLVIETEFVLQSDTN